MTDDTKKDSLVDFNSVGGLSFGGRDHLETTEEDNDAACSMGDGISTARKDLAGGSKQAAGLVFGGSDPIETTE